ncbi:MAG: hypothetical protein JSR46_06330 [Verrucomicrobia bacterium]|nr:hypothetical protein [Verrucomicrobiota bacterium]
MKKSIGIGVVCVAVAAFGYYYLGSRPEKHAGADIPTFLQQPITPVWKEFQPENGSFTVLFPGNVMHATATKPYGHPNEVTKYDTYSARGSDGTLYTLSEVQYPQSFDTKDPNAIFQSLIQNIVASAATTEIIGQTITTFSNHPAVDFNLQNLKYASIGRAILVGKTLYVLTVMSPNLNGLEEHFHAFADSLTLK